MLQKLYCSTQLWELGVEAPINAMLSLELWVIDGSTAMVSERHIGVDHLGDKVKHSFGHTELNLETVNGKARSQKCTHCRKLSVG
jgi:hypothetical protein